VLIYIKNTLSGGLGGALYIKPQVGAGSGQNGGCAPAPV